MASRLNPYVQLDGNAREALTRYAEIFGGEPQIHSYGDFGDPAAPEAGRVMHGMLLTDAGYTLMVADTPPGADVPTGTAITISLSGDDTEALRGYWAALAEGGQVRIPLEKQMWGDEFGELVDAFGVPWLVNVATGA